METTSQNTKIKVLEKILKLQTLCMEINLLYLIKVRIYPISYLYKTFSNDILLNTSIVQNINPPPIIYGMILNGPYMIYK